MVADPDAVTLVAADWPTALGGGAFYETSMIIGHFARAEARRRAAEVPRLRRLPSGLATPHSA